MCIRDRVWGIHTMDDPLLLNQNLIAIGWEETVSYTHLDVYKRQPKYCATIETAQVKKDEVVFTGEIPARCIQAVSYTHLYNTPYDITTSRLDFSVWKRMKNLAR